jgi:hypothetical protein
MAASGSERSPTRPPWFGLTGQALRLLATLPAAIVREVPRRPVGPSETALTLGKQRTISLLLIAVMPSSWQRSGG